jgi:hypothetical protein
MIKKVIMKHVWMTLLVFMSFLGLTKAQIQAPAIQWEASFGTDSTDGLVSAMVDQHGHIYLTGYTEQLGINGDKSYSKGYSDAWLIKLDANGQKLWDTVYGGSMGDVVLKAVEHDGEILISVLISSNDGDISDTVGRGGFDIWLIKVDVNGQKIWDKRYGSSGSDRGMAVRVQNGYLLVGTVHVADGDRTVPVTYGNWTWLAKLNNNGIIQWEKGFGVATGIDARICDIVPTNDGGSMLVLTTKGGIGGDKTDTSRGGYDMWLIKLDANGNIQWDKTLGNPNDDFVGYFPANLVVQCPDGSYIYANMSTGGNGGDKTSGYIDGKDIWVVKMDASGQVLWDKTIGTNEPDGLYDLAYTNDNGVILACISKGPASHDKTENSKGENDMWIVRMDSNGNILWDKTIGGDKSDGPTDIINLGSNGILVAGTSFSGISGDKSSASRGYSDIWVVKLGPEQSSGLEEAAGYPQLMDVYPNPVRDQLQFSQSADVQIRSIDGKLIHSAHQVGQVSVGHLSSGVYILQYKAPDGKIWQSAQIIKE